MEGSLLQKADTSLAEGTTFMTPFLNILRELALFCIMGYEFHYLLKLHNHFTYDEPFSLYLPTHVW